MTTEATATWYDLTDNLGVLELYEDLTAPGPALELHLLRTPTKTHACWVSEDGRMQWWVRVGEA